MKITTLICAAIAASALAGQMALADPPARNHGVDKRQQTQQERVGEEIREEKHDAQQR